MSDRKLGQQLAAGIEAGKRVEFTMGTQAAEIGCSICDKTGQHTHKPDFVYDINEGPTLMSVSFVSAPKCAECREPMEYLNQGTDWVCHNSTCKGFNTTVVTGIGGIVR